MVVKQIVPKAAFPHTASHTGKSLARGKLKKTAENILCRTEQKQQWKASVDD